MFHGAGQLLQVGPGLLHQRGVERLAAGFLDQPHELIAKLVDQPRHAAGGGVNGGEGLGVEPLLRLHANGRDLRTHVLKSFLAGERREVAAAGDALAEHVELRVGEPLFEDRAAGEHEAHQRHAVDDDVGEDAQLFEQARGEGVGFVDEERACGAGGGGWRDAVARRRRGRGRCASPAL